MENRKKTTLGEAKATELEKKKHQAKSRITHTNARTGKAKMTLVAAAGLLLTEEKDSITSKVVPTQTSQYSDFSRKICKSYQF